jgi:hypothetical protein
MRWSPLQSSALQGGPVETVWQDGRRSDHVTTQAGDHVGIVMRRLARRLARRITRVIHSVHFHRQRSPLVARPVAGCIGRRGRIARTDGAAAGALVAIATFRARASVSARMPAINQDADRCGQVFYYRRTDIIAYTSIEGGSVRICPQIAKS